MSVRVPLRTPRGRALMELEDPTDHISARIIRRRDWYERDLLNDMASRVRTGTAIDVGAHIGNHSLWMASCGLDVVALEPNPSSRAQLERNVALNNLRSKVKVLGLAAGRVAGRGRVKVLNPQNTGMSQVLSDDFGDIDIVTIDDLVLDNVTLIKIDVEGAELDILHGAQNTIARFHPVLYVEAAEESARRAVEAFLEPLGYTCFGRYALTPTYGFSRAQRRDIELSVTIMAHPAREAMVRELVDTLDGPAEIAWDRDNDRWETGRRALLSARDDATHHLVLQDDAIICRDLLAGVRRALERNPHCPTSLYLGRQRPHGPHFQRVMKQARDADATWIIGPELCWGVALVFPTELIGPMVAFGDEHPKVENYDKRLGMYLQSQKIPTWYTVPSLVDHRRQDVSPSLVPGRTGPNRVAHVFHGEANSALDIDWAAGRIAFEKRGTRQPPRHCPVCRANAYACAMPSVSQPEPVEVGD